MKKSVIFIIILVLTMPIALAENTVYIYGSKLIASKDDSGIKYHHQDYLGSNKITTNSNGEVISESIQYPYGDDFSEIGTKEGLENDFKYTGQEQDNHGLYYYGARYYQPSIGRFLSVDPVFSSSISPYAYANNNPMKFVDPTGAYYTVDFQQTEGPASPYEDALQFESQDKWEEYISKNFGFAFGEGADDTDRRSTYLTLSAYLAPKMIDILKTMGNGDSFGPIVYSVMPEEHFLDPDGSVVAAHAGCAGTGGICFQRFAASGTGIFFHELGHMVYMYGLTSEQALDWEMRAIVGMEKQGLPSEYAYVNYEEAFAEVFAYSVMLQMRTRFGEKAHLGFLGFEGDNIPGYVDFVPRYDDSLRYSPAFDYLLNFEYFEKLKWDE